MKKVFLLINFAIFSLPFTQTLGHIISNSIFLFIWIYSGLVLSTYLIDERRKKNKHEKK